MLFTALLSFSPQAALQPQRAVTAYLPVNGSLAVYQPLTSR